MEGDHLNLDCLVLSEIICRDCFVLTSLNCIRFKFKCIFGRLILALIKFSRPILKFEFLVL